jgi:hypothetical protein
MTEAQKQWLADHPQYQPVGRPRPDVRFINSGTLYADGTFDPLAPMKPIRLRDGCFGVGIVVHPNT